MIITFVMLCIKTVFAVKKCLSVHVSVTIQNCIKSASLIMKIYENSSPDSPDILVFLY